MDVMQLIASIQDAFIKQDDYQFDKHVPTFESDGMFLGDYFNQLAVESRGELPPRFYHTFSPFDVISNQAPHRAVVFEAGKIILDIDFDKYVAMRTAAMSSVVLSALGTKSLEDKRVLLFGAGKIATEAVGILRISHLMQSIDVMTKSGNLDMIRHANPDVTIKSGSLDELGEYDVIICHTQTSEPLISKDALKNLKQGAVLTSFITSTDHGELPVEAYDTKIANIIMDWQPTLNDARDLKNALEEGLCSENDIFNMKQLLLSNSFSNDKRYTIYRSTGTPIQNLAVLKTLI